MALRIGDLAQSQLLSASLAGDAGAAPRGADRPRARARLPRPSTRSPTGPASFAGQGHEGSSSATLADQSERLDRELQMMDGALGAVVDIADRARVALVQRLDGGLGDDVPLDSQVDALLGELEAALNTRFDGQYLFAGSGPTRPR